MALKKLIRWSLSSEKADTSLCSHPLPGVLHLAVESCTTSTIHWPSNTVVIVQGFCCLLSLFPALRNREAMSSRHGLDRITSLEGMFRCFVVLESTKLSINVNLHRYEETSH
ncbi:uncharacterized protein LOC143443705 [Arvicanthis niloticus]|uniref:uncharacterized protein LOC143313980 n=1 Tax=Arvicanthis niloticus TaxID=61156 RepID=UPI00402B0BF6